MSALFLINSASAATIFSEDWTGYGTPQGIGPKFANNLGFGAEGDHLFSNFGGSTVSASAVTSYFGLAGDTIGLSFAASSYQYVSTAGTLTVSLTDGLDGTVIQSYTVDPLIDALTVGWPTYNFSYVLPADTTNALHVKFTAVGSANPEQFLMDSVVVTAVPEPSAALLGGLGVLAMLRRRRA